MEDDRQAESAVQWAFKNSNHKASVRFVLVALAECIDHDNSCPSQKELAELTGLSKDTIRRALRELEKDGTIVITRKGGDKVRGGNKDCYQLPAYSYQPLAASIQQVAASCQQDTISTSLAASTQQAAASCQHVATSMAQSVKPKIEPVEYARARARAAGEKGSLDSDIRSPKDKSITTTTLPGPHYQQGALSVVDSSGDKMQIAFTPETVATPLPPDKPLQELDNDLGRVARCYENNIAPLVEIMRARLLTALDVYSADWIIEAIGIAVAQNKRTWAYVNGILSRWMREGKNAPPKKLSPQRQSRQVTPEELELARRAFLFDVPVFPPIQAATS